MLVSLTSNLTPSGVCPLYSRCSTLMSSACRWITVSTRPGNLVILPSPARPEPSASADNHEVYYHTVPTRSFLTGMSSDMAVISTAAHAVPPLTFTHVIPNCSALIGDPWLSKPHKVPTSTCNHTNSTSPTHVSSSQSGLALHTAVPIICAFLILLFVICFTYRHMIQQLVRGGVERWSGVRAQLPICALGV